MHQPVTPPPAAADTLDLTSVLVLAVIAAVIVAMFWKVIVKLAIVGALALVFAGFLVPVWMFTSHH